MSDEKAVICIFQYKNGREVEHQLFPSHFRDQTIIVLDGTFFARTRVIYVGDRIAIDTARVMFSEALPPLEIVASQHALHPKLNPTLQTHTGKMVSITDTNVYQIDVEDIAHSLSMLCRYNGHTSNFYSVAEHSVLIARWLRAEGYDEDTQRVGLIHDAPEYLTGDMTKPFKSVVAPIYRPIQNRLWSKMAARFNVAETIPDIVHTADLRILMNEKAQAFMHDVEWGWSVDPLPGVKLKFWAPSRAKQEFLSECRLLNLI